MRSAAVLAVFALAVTAGSAWSAESNYRFAPPGTWVDVLAAPAAVARPAGSSPASAAILLLDRQINVTATGDDVYRHVVAQVLNADGVSNYSQLDLGVDPTYQSLDVHWLRVIRDGRVVDQRPTARISELAEETDLRNQIYNGRHSVDVLLADVRPGDVVDYAVTLHSRELLYPGHFAARLDTGWSVPVQRQRIRVRAPPSRALRFRRSDASPPREPVVRDGTREWLFEWSDLAPVVVDASVPSWYSVWPFLEVSDLDDWGDVSKLVTPLFTAKAPVGEASVREVADRLRAGGGTAAELALHALQFVQEEIRYTSIAIGRGSHEPSAPATVLERRFGDCKDKSLLLAALLRELGIDSRVALVNTARKRALDSQLPTPYAFDHAIVRARIDGRTLWLDATAATQYSPVSAERSVGYERALVLDSATTALEPIPPPSPTSRSRDVMLEWDLRKGVEAPATLTITTQYHGTLADSMRPALARGNLQQRQSDYESYVARWYPGARAVDMLTVADDRTANTVHVVEHYQFARAFTPNDKGVLELVLHTDELYPYFEPLGAGGRHTPIAQEYPILVHQRIVAHLPHEWPVEQKTVRVENKAFQYRGTVGYAARTLQLDYEYQALAESASADAIGTYEADRARVYDDLGFKLSSNPAAGVTPDNLTLAPVPASLWLGAFVLAVWGGLRLYRYDPDPPAFEKSWPHGIAGWLVLPAFGVIVGPFVAAWALFEWTQSATGTIWYALPKVVDEAHRGSAHLMAGFSIASSVLVFALTVLTALLFFKKRSSAPLTWVVLTWVSVVWGNGILIWGVTIGLDHETNPARAAGGAVRDVVVAMAWTAYMFSSRRVRATFVERWRPAPPAVAPGQEPPGPPGAPS